MIPHRSTAGRSAALAAAALAMTLSLQAAAQSDAATTVIESLMWATESNGENLPWDEAEAYCETLELEGHDDWRLPTLVELQSLHDPDADASGRIQTPIELTDCCAWSSTNLVELEADRKGVLPDPTNPPASYYWGFLFSSGIRYYSFRNFPDGEALCVRQAED